jgi:FtsP/CotA-like multicopper oxidase with cupredoxin domain
MSMHSEPTAHEHTDHGHASHGHAGHDVMVHEPGADVAAAYRRAYDDAQPDPGRSVVRVDLEAREAEWRLGGRQPARAWTFNGQVPGPVIDARVGDVLEVRLTNRLTASTMLHWHGLRLPAAMDGTDMVQHPVAPGETFVYRIKLLDAGTFWYHSHSDEPVQVKRGMYGALIVRADDEPVLDRERVLVLSDANVEPTGELSATVPPEGRDGNVRLVNGAPEPELMIWGGQVERWRVINAASARYIRLSIGGRAFTALGTGGGLLEAPVRMQDVLLAPGERADIAVGPFEPGEVLSVVSEPYDRGFGAGETEQFATLHVGPSAPSHAVVPERLRVISPLAVGPVTPTRVVTFSERPDAHGEVDFLINGRQHYRAEPAVVDELQVWDLVNTSSLDHPFHLHGFFFQVLERNGAAPAFRSWEDTVNVPAKGRVRIAWVPDDRPGEWMYHCHILEHHAAGMMAHFAVVRAGDEHGQATMSTHHHHAHATSGHMA